MPTQADRPAPPTQNVNGAGARRPTNPPVSHAPGAEVPGAAGAGAAGRMSGTALPQRLSPLASQGVDLDALEPVFTLDTALLLLAGVALGSFLAAVILPALLPELAASLLGEQPKAFWYLSRSAGVIAYLALWLSAVLGLALTSRSAKLWGGGPAVADVHQFASLLSLALVVFHVVILLGDSYASYSIGQLLIPFAATQHEPAWVGLGQLGFYLSLPVVFSFYLRRRIGTHTWRLIHYGSFALYVLTVAHGLGAGSDSHAPAVLSMYLTTACTVLFLTCYRVLTAAGRRRTHGARATR